MAEPPNGGTAPGGAQDGIPQLMIAQAQAAVASEHDTSDDTAQERRHAGRDVPMTTSPDLDVAENTTEGLPDHPPPAYGEHFGQIYNEHDGFGTDARVGDDGRVNIRVSQTQRKLGDVWNSALRRQQEAAYKEQEPPPPYIPPFLGGEEGVPPPPPMNVVIQIVGSRGDVQPFVALGKVLKDTYGHRVRLATHPVFKDFVMENGLEFFSIGGDPAQLMAFMVKNPGLMPGFDTLRSGDVGKRRKEVGEYLRGCWRSCFESGSGLGPEASDDTIEDWTSEANENNPENKPFVADCIIANPPSFAHIHCVEKLGIPLHIMFTMPYSPTQAFPHPLANVQSSNADPNLTNYITYALIDMLTWQGLGDVINQFRSKKLGLEPISLLWAPGMLQRLHIPHTYCWSPALIPKPKDWGQSISISGFFFLDLAVNYQPAPELKAFLDAGPPPVYIGFGSIVLDDPNAMTELIFEAVRKTGQRVLLSKGWGGMGAEELGIPESVFMLGNCPHDWLFKRVSCVVHHGGAGTTAAGITAGKPTVVVPFFGDQPFWGSMVARAGAGPEPLPHKELTAEKLADAIMFCLKPESQERAKDLASKIAKEKGSQVGAQSFHQMLDVDKLRCTLAPSRIAVWRIRRTQVRLSSFAACTLANEGLLDFNDLKLFRGREYETEDGPWDPITGGATALVGTMSTMMMGMADMPIETLKALKIHPDSVKKRNSPSVEDREKPSEEQRETSTSGATPRESAEQSTSAVSSEETTPGISRPGSTFNLQESLDRIQGQPGPGSRLSPRSSSMADALQGKLASSRTRSRSRSNSGSKSKPGSGDVMETATGTAKGVNKILGAGFKSPMDFTMALAQGFHNAPRLYGDETVRKNDQVTDLRSGIKAATKGFGYGMYDGITGLVTQPMKGAQKEGAAGFIKGFGKGIGGIMLKPGAAIFSIPGYTMKGVYKEIQKAFGSSVQNYIIAARTAQGFDDWQAASDAERADVVRRWKSIQGDIKRKKDPDEIVKNILREKRQKHKEWVGDLKSEWAGRRSRSGTMNSTRQGDDLTHIGTTPERPNVSEGKTRLRHANTVSAAELRTQELDEVIRLSVQETSIGDSAEDAEVEKAVRASLQEAQARKSSQALPTSTTAGDEDDDDDVKRAIEASLAVAQPGESELLNDEELERVLTQSLMEQRNLHGDSNMAHDDTDTEDDEDYQRALIASQEAHHPGPSNDDLPGYEAESSHLSGTTQAEFEAIKSQNPGEKTQKEKDDEQTVLEYVKKQSALEQEHRSGMSKGKGRAA